MAHGSSKTATVLQAIRYGIQGNTILLGTVLPLASQIEYSLWCQIRVTPGDLL